MEFSFDYAVGGAFTAWIAVDYIATSFLHLEEGELWIVRGALAVAGAAVVALVEYYHKKHEREEEGGGLPGEGGETDIDSLLAHAERRLAASKLGPEARFEGMPVVFVTGPAGSTKTTAVMQSGLDPELLAGQVYRDGAIAPTGLANVWLAQQAVFVEAGPKVQGDAHIWRSMIGHLHPGKLRTAAAKGETAPRVAVVCYECENFLNPGSADKAGESAKAIRGQLSEVCAALGLNLPVYVLFTKLDRVAFFLDYVRTLDNREASQVFGVTLPIAARDEGVYGERESQRLSEAFQQLAFGLCDKRPEFLIREPDPNALPATYEFPREFRKLRAPLVQFLLELCRPSQLSEGPFLRGFYFTGVRPVVIQEELAAEAPRSQGSQQAGYDPGATRMFRQGEAQGRAATAPVGRMTSKKVPQWVFLPHLFGDVVLADRAAMGASGVSAKANILRRALLATAACVCLLFGILTLVSFFQNRALVREVRESAEKVASDPNSAKLASVESLTRLDTLREALIKLTGYERAHPPLMMRWGLYTGSALLPEARRLYFDRYKLLLFGDIQQGFLGTMRSWPASPGPRDDYGYDYNTLKAYLETTSNHDKATLQFLPPLLGERWAAGKTIDPARLKLARNQFDFYTSELVIRNPYAEANDAATVESARKYLAQFAGAARVYQAMLTDANARNKSVVFNQRFPGSSEVVLNTRDMAGAYSKPGFAFMENAIKNPGKYVSGEQWVLGDKASAAVDTSKLGQEIQALYYADFINQWRDYLKKSVVVKYATLQDAAHKLTITSSPQSPLLALFWLASQNTDVNAPPIQQAFKPLHTLMPPAMVDQYIGPSNTNYMTSLTSLQSSIEQASKLPPEQNQAAADQTASAATAARLVTRQTALTFGLDPDAHIEATIEKLMEDPITYAEAVKPQGPSPAPLNAAGAAFCSQYRALSSKYPFNPAATAQATLDEVNGIFQPMQGALWTFYEGKLKKLLPKQGGAYVSTGEKPAITPRFLTFFNNAARFSNALYANGASQQPKLAFALKPAFSSDVQNVALSIDGQMANFKPGGAAQQFTWPGNGGVKLTVKNGSDFIYPTYDGLWGVFEFFQDADKPVPSPEWMLKSGRRDKPVTSPVTNQPVVVHFDLDALGGPPVFQKGYFQSLACVAEVAK